MPEKERTSRRILDSDRGTDNGPALHPGRTGLPRRSSQFLPKRDSIGNPPQDERGTRTRKRRHRYLPAHLERERLGGATLADGVGRSAMDADPAIYLDRGTTAEWGSAAAAVQLRHGRTGDRAFWLRRAKKALSAAHRESRRLVVPRIFGTRRRLRSRGA